MKFLIVGADGQLGQEWVHVLTKQNFDYSAYHYRDLDITDFEKLEDVIRKESPETIINCAAYTAVDKAEEEFELANLINHTAVEKLSECCVKYKIKLIHYSTDYVFAGEVSDRNTYPSGYPETAKPDPLNTYGISKLKGEQAIEQSGCEYLILRLSWLCGAFGNNFLKTMLRLSKERKSLNVVNDQFGVPTFTNQTVLDTLGLIKKSANGLFHLGSDGIITWYEFALKIFELSNIEIDVEPVKSSEFKTTAKRPSFSKLDTKKVENELMIASLPWEEGLEKLLMQLKDENN